MEPPTETEIPQHPPIGIGEQLVARLEERGIIIKTEEFERVGVAASEGTNETGSPLLFEKVRNHEQAPNGYLIGVGFGNVFSMLEAFPQGSKPRAILLFDVDPNVVAYGKRFIEEWKNTPDSPPEESNPPDSVFRERWVSDYKVALKKYGPLLQQLAKDGNLVIEQADFTDSRLIEELTQLPDLKDSNNLVYLSNIADHLYRRFWSPANPDYVPNFSVFNRLNPDPPHKNYFIDTLSIGQLDYELRARTQPPNFEKSHFWPAPFGFNWQTRPIDEIDGEVENPIWEDISFWNLDHLADSYKSLQNNQRQLARREYTQNQISQERKGAIETYDEVKRKSQEPPEQLTPHLQKRYRVPEDPEAEKASLRLLQEPYDYDHDFIPTIAEKIWADAKSPFDIKFHSIHSIERIKEDPQTGQRYILQDPRYSLKGILEYFRIKSGLTYEELAMAKVYQEVKRRLLIKNPKAKTDRKTFDELVEILQFGRPG